MNNTRLYCKLLKVGLILKQLAFNALWYVNNAVYNSTDSKLHKPSTIVISCMSWLFSHLYSGEVREIRYIVCSSPNSIFINVDLPGRRSWRQYCHLMYTCPEGGYDVNIATWCARVRMEVMTSTLLPDVHVPGWRSWRQHCYMICTCPDGGYDVNIAIWYARVWMEVNTSTLLPDVHVLRECVY